MVRVYIAGALNSDACGYIKNLHRMIHTSERVRRAGFSVLVPGLDFLVGLQMGDMDYIDFIKNNEPWLLVSEAVFLTPGWEDSKGTQNELKLARQHRIPIFSSLLELQQYFKNEID